MELAIYLFVTAIVMAFIGYLIGAGKISLKPATFLTILFILLLPFILNFAIWLYASSTPETTVPNVMGSPTSEAITLLEAAGLKGEVTGISFSKEPGGTIISQRPEGGKRVKRGRLINLIISAREVTPAVPNLIGKQSNEAENLLKSMGFSLGQIYGIVSDEAYGIIVEQSPLPGETASPGTNVTITISLGNKSPAETQPGAETND